MQALVTRVLLAGTADESSMTHISNYTPFYDADSTWTKLDSGETSTQKNHETMRCCCFNTHFLPEMIPLHTNTTKAIYVVRNGRDVVTSYFHHLSNQAGAGGDFDADFLSFLRLWCGGDLPYSHWIDHILAWIKESKRTQQILIVRYEDLSVDLHAGIARVAAFLDRPLTSDQISSIAAKLTFTAMKSDISRYQPVSVAWKNNFSFIREGSVGTAAFADEEQETLYQAMLREKLASEDDRRLLEELGVL